MTFETSSDGYTNNNSGNGSMRALRWVALGLLTFVLSACGGGGSGGDSPEPSITLSPASLQARHLTGRSVTLNIIATASAPITESVFVTIRDDAGVLGPTLNIFQNDATSHRVELATSRALQPGHHVGSLIVSICFNQACTRKIHNSPITLPYDFTIDPFPPAMETTGTLTGTYTVGFPSYGVRLSFTNAKGNWLGLSNTAGVFEREITLAPNLVGTLVVRPLATLAPGHYTGSVEFHACAGTLACTTPTPETRNVTVPFDITVRPLSTLSRQPGVADWEMFQGDSRHRGHVALTVDPSKIVPRWQWVYPVNATDMGTYLLHPLVISQGHIYAASNYGELYTVREQDASVAWSRDFRIGEWLDLNHPAVSDGRLYIQTTDSTGGGGSGGTLWALDAADGDELFHSPILSQSSRYMAPTIKDGVLYTQGGTVGGLYGFDAATGQETFFRQLPQADMWVPTVDGQYVYTYLRAFEQLHIHDRATGQFVDQIDPSEGGGFGEYGTTILGSAGSVIGMTVARRLTNQQGALAKFDITARTESWSHMGAYVGAAAYADQIIYAVNNEPLRLEARAESNGDLLWSWSPPADGPPLGPSNTFMSDVLVIDNLVFVSTNAGTWAIDRTTHQSVWSYPKFGRLSMSANGTLFITYGDITAFDTL
jgi:outer membrane protein assembly factor BamB